jgi:hypothetical protein
MEYQQVIYYPDNTCEFIGEFGLTILFLFFLSRNELEKNSGNTYGYRI